MSRGGLESILAAGRDPCSRADIRRPAGKAGRLVLRRDYEREFRLPSAIPKSSRPEWTF